MNYQEFQLTFQACRVGRRFIGLKLEDTLEISYRVVKMIEKGKEKLAELPRVRFECLEGSGTLRCNSQLAWGGGGVPPLTEEEIADSAKIA